MSGIMNSILEAIGNTPLVRLNKVTEGLDSDILVKCEYMNPSGSLKDRVAKYMLATAEKEGKLKPGYTVIEASTGNMGIALAMVCARIGYKFICCMPSEMTEERSRILKMYGAEIHDTGSIFMEEGVVQFVHREVAQEIEQTTPNTWWARQFSNWANIMAHKETTGYEIIKQTGGNLDAYVMSVGSAGTLMGVALAIREKLPEKTVKIVAVEPTSSPMLAEGKAGYHAIPGISDGIIPEILDKEIYDELVLVSDNDAKEMAHRLRSEEGLFCGISAGANVVASMKVAREIGKGKTIVTILPDSADRYFSMEEYVV
ncbi:MAG: PLP-dependent cysteine synthase family protein [Candidatus Hodarchaeota archaeon]